MKNEHTNQEIHWRSHTIYVDIDTGEMITEEEAKKEYVVITTKKKTNVYKTTGTIEWHKHCKRSSQGRLFD